MWNAFREIENQEPPFFFCHIFVTTIIWKTVSNREKIVSKVIDNRVYYMPLELPLEKFMILQLLLKE